MKKGFTLIELLVVILIIGILAAVALPQYRIAVAKSRIVKFWPVCRYITDQMDLYTLENGGYTSDLDLLGVPFTYMEKKGTGDYITYVDTPAGDLTVSGRWHSVGLEDKEWALECMGKKGTVFAYCQGINHSAFGQKLCQVLGGVFSHTNAHGRVYRIDSL